MRPVVIDPLDIAQARTAPESVVRGLRETDPSLALLHSRGLRLRVGRGSRWLLCRYAPDRIDASIARAILENWQAQFDAGARYTHEIHTRLRQARLALLGWKQVAVYDVFNDEFGPIEQDVRRARWHLLHTSDNQLFQSFDDATDARRDAAIADIGSIDRAKDAWKYAYTRSHRWGTSLTPEIGPKAGWKREMTLS